MKSMVNFFCRNNPGGLRSPAGLLLAGALFLCACSPALRAAPFDKQIEYRQPDGTVVQLHGKGDEFSAVFETLSGYTVVHDKALNAYCFALVDAGGHLVSSGTQVHTADPASLGLAPHLRMSPEVRKQMVVERYQRWEQATQTRARWEALKAERHAASQDDPSFIPPPVTGVRVGLTLLVDFSDDMATVPQAEVVNFLNGDAYRGFNNNGSVKEYFYDNSDGNLIYTNVVTIYIRAPQPKTFYNDTTKDAGDQGNLLIKDIIDTMKALPDYTTTILPLFDNLSVDANNQVLACNVFYAGGNGGVWAMGLWPHSWSLFVVGAQELSPGGKKVWRYQITNIGTELSLGTFCHENGHMLLSYPDLYDYDYDSAGGAGNYCLMGFGGADKNPVQICAYLKLGSGWARVTDLDINSATIGVVTAPIGPNFNRFYRYLKPNTPTEYYLVENRQRQARDASAPGSGIAIWHIDELGDRDNQNLNYNTSHSNFEVTLVQADNQWHLQRNVNAGDAQDLFFDGNPAAAYSGLFSDTTTPSARWWDGSNSGLYFFNFSSNANTMTFRVGLGDESLRVDRAELVDANRNGVIEVNECSDFFVVLTNVASFTATGIKGTLTTTTTNVTIGQRTSPYPNIPPGELGTNLLAFKISTSPEFICGTPIDLVLFIQSDQTIRTNTFRLNTGIPSIPLRFDNNVGATIPANDRTGVFSTINVSNINFTLSRITVSLHATYPFDQFLTLQLVAPDGTTNLLSSGNGDFGQNYGLSCVPDSVRTTFDDNAPIDITAGGPPFVGSYKPEQPLSVFSGKSGTNVNGAWRLQAISGANVSGQLLCWSLFITPSTCVDGGGECPGSDLAVGMTALPEPVFIGNALTYTITATNFGPSAAQNVVLSQVLPPSLLYVSSTPSQGSVSYAGGVVSCNLGRISSGARASVMVTVLPTSAGFVTSSATITSEQPDFDPINNTVSVLSQVNPPTADLAVGILANPASVTLGSSFNYLVGVTNKGPSFASGVTVTNVLPASISILNTSVSQGIVSVQSNVVVLSIGSLTNGQSATATISASPTAEGTFVASAMVLANQSDPILANNNAFSSLSVGPAADLEIALLDSPDPIVIGSNLTYTVYLTNRGPSIATSVVVNQAVDPSVTLVSATPSTGTALIQGNSVSANFGSLPAGASASMKVVVVPKTKKTLSSTASISGGQVDPEDANNTAIATTLVDDPFVAFAAAGAQLEFEGFQPVNGSIDAGETVTAMLYLRNAGNVSNTNLVASLVPTNGVLLTPTNSSQVYGRLIPGDFPQPQRFSFTVSPTNSGTLNVVLALQDGASQSSVAFQFLLPVTRTFTNPGAITIRDNNTAVPYSSPIAVSGLTGVVGKVTATLRSLSHGYPEDVDVLLANAAGQNVLLMSGAGAPPVQSANVTFDDSAPSTLPNSLLQILSGSYKPASYNPGLALPAPAPVPAYGTGMSALNSGSPNGTWSLFVADHALGDSGSIAQGWSLAITMLTPVNKVADLGLVARTTPNPVLAAEALTCTYTITNAGPDPASFIAFTNVIPANASLVSASASHGTVTADPGMVVVSIPSLAVGAVASVNVTIVPSSAAAGTLQSVATVNSSVEVDLNKLNNTAPAVATVILPSADLTVSQVATPNPVITGSNVTFQIEIRNVGPQDALGVVLTNALPPGMSLVSASSSVGDITVSGGAVLAELGNLQPGATAQVSIEAHTSVAGPAVNLVRILSASTDPAPANNVSSLVVSVVNPSPKIVAAGARLISESKVPANGAVDPGETVTIEFSLSNDGTAPASNVRASLLAGGGVLSPTGEQIYGLLSPGGSAVGRQFTFTAGDVTTFTATMDVFDGAASQGQVQYVFKAPSVHNFTNSFSILIPNRGASAPYPAEIEIAGLQGIVSSIEVSLHDVNHSFPRDVNALLVSPSGDSVMLMAHMGGGRPLTNVFLKFSDNAGALPSSAQIVSGTYRPTASGVTASLPAPAPGMPYASKLSAVAGLSPNGTWSLYVFDDSTGDAGIITKGWSLQLTVIEPVNAISDLSIAMESSPSTLYIGSGINHVVTVENRGPSDARLVQVDHLLPAGVSFVLGLGSQGTFEADTNTVIWNIGDLAAGATAKATIRVVPSIGLPIVSPMTVSSPGGSDLNSVNNTAQTTTTVISPAQVSIAMQVVETGVQITVTGQAGQSYAIQATADLTSWTTLTTQVADSTGKIQYTDTGASGESARLYRAVRQVP